MNTCDFHRLSDDDKAVVCGKEAEADFNDRWFCIKHYVMVVEAKYMPWKVRSEEHYDDRGNHI